MAIFTAPPWYEEAISNAACTFLGYRVNAICTLNSCGANAGFRFELISILEVVSAVPPATHFMRQLSTNTETNKEPSTMLMECELHPMLRRVDMPM